METSQCDIYRIEFLRFKTGHILQKLLDFALWLNFAKNIMRNFAQRIQYNLLNIFSTIKILENLICSSTEI